MLQKKILHVEWHCPISELAEQFDHFRSTNVIGIANDLSPHYRYVKYVVLAKENRKIYKNLWKFLFD